MHGSGHPRVPIVAAIVAFCAIWGAPLASCWAQAGNPAVPMRSGAAAPLPPAVQPQVPSRESIQPPSPVPQGAPLRRSPDLQSAASLKLSDSSTAEQKFLIERVDPARTLDVTIGRPTVLRFQIAPFRDQIGDPEIVDVLSITETELSITGKKVGSTVLNLWFNDGRSAEPELLSYLVRVAEDPELSRQYDLLLENLEREVNRGFPNSVVKLSYVGSQVVVRGKARDIEDATNILRIVSQSLPTEQQVTNSQQIVPAASQNTNQNGLIQPASFQGANGFTINEIVEAGGLDSIFNGQSPTGANTTQINQRVVNMLEIAGVHQVMLKVTLAEVARDSGRSLFAEANYASSGRTVTNQVPLLDGQGQIIRDANNNPIFQAVQVQPPNDFQARYDPNGGEVSLQTGHFFLRLNALKRLSLARSLSEPNLTTLSGQPANFLVGGQFPIATAVASTNTVVQQIQYVPFGIQLSVVPTVTDGDRIRLQLQATISEQGGGFGGQAQANQNNDPNSPPSLTTRNFQSTVELRDSESLALAGLIQTRMTATKSGVPFLGDLPLVGNLFSRRTNSSEERELIVVVTPYLVAPVGAPVRRYRDRIHLNRMISSSTFVVR